VIYNIINQSLKVCPIKKKNVLRFAIHSQTLLQYEYPTLEAFGKSWKNKDIEIIKSWSRSAKKSHVIVFSAHDKKQCYTIKKLNLKND
jgi:hypothetical protein